MLLTNGHATNGQFILLGGSIVNIYLLVAIVDLMMYFGVFKNHEVSQIIGFYVHKKIGNYRCYLMKCNKWKCIEEVEMQVVHWKMGQKI